MKFAIYASIFGPYADPQTLVNLACDVEQAGWDIKKSGRARISFNRISLVLQRKVATITL